VLYLNPPFHIIDGVSLFPDHEDPLQYYMLPLSPQLTVLTEPGSGQRIPQLQVIRFAGEAGTGGFLNFDVNIGADQQRIDAISEELRSRAGLDGTPRLAPVLVIDGSVRMMLFGKESPPPDEDDDDRGPATPAATPGTPEFVIKINHAAKPSLYGDNQAAFSVQLDAEGVTILDQALQGEMSPIGVVYSLTYVALRPAYHVRVSADWNRVYEHMSESFGIDTLFYSSQIDEVVDKLVEDRAIVIEADTFVAESEEDGAGIASRRDQALDEVRDMVTDAFFTPSLEPMKEETGFPEDFRRVLQAVSTGGMGSMFTRKEVDLTRLDHKTLNADLSERTAVTRSIYPQGHLAGLFRVLEQEGLDRSRFVISVNLDDDFFKRRQVRVIPQADFVTDGIASIEVALTYGPHTQSVLFREDSVTEQSAEWQSIVDGGVMKPEVDYHFEVNFAALDGTQRPASITSPTETITGTVANVNPRDLYTVMQVPIKAIDFPWASYPQVELDLLYEDQANGVRVENHYLLDQTTLPQTAWQVFLLDQAKRDFSYRLKYSAADQRDVQGAWVTPPDGQVTVADPYPRKRRFDVVCPSGLFPQLDRAFVDVWYEDPANSVSKEQSFEFAAANAGTTQTFSVELIDPTQRRIGFKGTMLFADGKSVEIPPSFTLAERLILRADLKGHRVITFRSAPVDFTAKGLTDIVVEAKQTGGGSTDNLTLAGQEDRASFEFDYVDTATDSYEYRPTLRYANGMTQSYDWQSADSDEVVIAVP
jgi:hypothetical protein